MSKIQGGHGNALTFNVIPDIQFRPVADREYPDVLALINSSIENIPELGALALRIPLSEFIPHGKYTFFRTGFLFIPACTANTGVKAIALNYFQQGERLQSIPARILLFLFDRPALVDGILHVTDNQLFTQFGNQLIAEFEGLNKIMPGVYMHQGKRKFSGPEGFAGQMNQRYGILPTGKQQGRLVKLARYLSQYGDCLGL